MNFRSSISAGELKRLYLDERLTIDEIAARFDLSHTSVRRRMEELGVQARPRGPYVGRHRVYEHDQMWSPELAYAVGLIATDGNLSSDGRHLSITSADINLLETARACLQLTNTITHTVRGGFNSHTYYRLQWGDRAFYDWLLSIGLMPAKSLRLGQLAIPGDYMADFFRGCIDGDGSIVTYTDRYNTFKSEKYVYERLFVSLVSASRPFLEWMRATLDRLMDVQGALHVRTSKPGHAPMGKLVYAKYESIRLLKWMYYSPDVPCLTRKREKALKFLGEAD